MNLKKFGRRLVIVALLVALFSTGEILKVSSAMAYPASSMGLEFITTSTNETAEIGFGGNLQAVTIDWGDGTPVQTIPDGSSVPDAFYTHVYASAGTYVAVISATTLEHFGHCQWAPNNWNLKRILSWGNLNTTSFKCAAWSRTALTSIPTNIPNTVTDISWMFYDTHEFNQNLSAWDTSNVTKMERAFSSTRAYNQSLGDWDISNVTNLDYMFSGELGFDDTAYSNTLTGWAKQSVHTNLTLGSLSAQATGCPAIEARNTLISLAGWAISDTAPTQVCTAQTVTWSPTNTSSLPGTLTPNALATGSDLGAISYAVSDAGGSGCSVNASSGVINAQSAGTCVVRATAAATPGFYSGATTASFVFTAPAPTPASVGEQSLSATGSNALTALFLGIGVVTLGILLLLVLFVIRRRKI